MDLNIMHKPKNLLENNMGENLGDLEYGNDFIDTTRGIIHKINN